MFFLAYHIEILDGINTLRRYSLPLSTTSNQAPPAVLTPPSSQSSSSSTRISPAVLFIIVIVAVIFFISGLLHLLVRFLARKNPTPSSSQQWTNYPAAENSGSEALQRQLQQLFHLHDSGLDQAFIDALPVFSYCEIVGTKEPFDCAVCLCEFASDDHLRLLPVCGHAFHLNCIDTWLLSNSTCPLCRGALYVPGITIENPIFDFEVPRDEDGCSVDREGAVPEEITSEKRVFSVRLGKFMRLSNGNETTDIEAGSRSSNDTARSEVGETSSSNLDARRCFSMGSYQYVVVDADLCVALSNGSTGRTNDKIGKERGLSGNLTINGAEEGRKIGIGSKGESLSVSKIWLWSNKKGKIPVSSDTSSSDGGLPWFPRTKEDS